MSTNMDPKVIAALIGGIAVLLSAIISYIISKNVEQRKSTLEYLRNKIALLEKKKKELLSLGREKPNGKVTKNNLVNKAATAIENSYDASVATFHELSHYLDAESVKHMIERITLMDKSLTIARGEHILGESFQEVDKHTLLKGIEALSEMTNITNSIRTLIADELSSSVQQMEKLSGLHK